MIHGVEEGKGEVPLNKMSTLLPSFYKKKNKKQKLEHYVYKPCKLLFTHAWIGFKSESTGNLNLRMKWGLGEIATILLHFTLSQHSHLLFLVLRTDFMTDSDWRQRVDGKITVERKIRSFVQDSICFATIKNLSKLNLILMTKMVSN